MPPRKDQERLSEEREVVLDELQEAVQVLERCALFALLIPEVRTNLAYALEDAESVNDIAAVEGRITVVRGFPKAAGPVKFGASSHLARLILELRKYDQSIRSALNFRWDEKILGRVENYCSKKRLFLGAIDRSQEPLEVRKNEGASVKWKVKTLVESSGGRVPKIFYETPGWGKEPLFLLVDTDPLAVVATAVDIAKFISTA